VFGDYNSVRWILHLEVGDRLTLDVGPDGTQVELLLVGLLDRSVFQSELLMSAQHFERYFPGESGFGFYAFDVPVDQVPGLALDLERDLEAYGFDVMAASERAARFQAVENTYLSTFQTLGGLGLILGTLGLAIVSIRNALERRGELAVQRAFGFTRARLYRMLLTESGVLLLVGVVLGTGCALAAVLPHLGGTAVPWKSLAVTLGLVVAVGMASAAIAALLAMQAKLLPALKSG
jgi:ABC-type antimicrobial peptide transport system permease subunit